jgi:hypothetical protein
MVYTVFQVSWRRRTMPKRLAFMIVFFLSALVLSLRPGPLHGQVFFEGEKSRIYLGLTYSYNNTSGKSFDGEFAFSSSGQYMPIPKLKAASGFSAVLGLRGEDIGVELSYSYAGHDGTLKDPTLPSGGTRMEKVGNHDFNIDLKGHIRPGSRLEGYYQIGLAIVFVSVGKSIFGVENEEWKTIGDVVYQAAGIDIGVGLDFWLSRRIGLTAGLFYRPLFFSTAKETLYEYAAEMGTLDIDVSGMKGHSLGLNIGILFNLK